jgi:hypothetical protein
MSERKANFIGTSYWSNKCSISKINNHLAEIPKREKIYFAFAWWISQYDCCLNFKTADGITLLILVVAEIKTLIF